MAGTSAQVVGNYVANYTREPNAYRVLSAYGRLNENFQGTGENDQRDPRQVLEAEGVVFNEDGHASEQQRFSTGELEVLVDLPDEALNEEAALTPG